MCHVVESMKPTRSEWVFDFSLYMGKHSGLQTNTGKRAVNVTIMG
jgi:hypothetical protein